ncbi:hypothetical protein GWN26_14085 [Candidatus Saccharibacteria bacterium]|nr:hypothetical protein [Candidatus Saccharibacteria bacterium]NIV04396.1 hypothetical protein [Calditrichia bacterium]NIV72941.1 hypothetical protein [Calditrichia bacterium]NIW00181.1 hypothetical protein [Candidatus Saccharibacteria bacterium]NIW80532.1 hypothetical protein [Calditrichia bacterium]
MRIISKKFLSEGELIQWLEISRDQLDKLRLEEGLPFIRVTRTIRKYPLKEIEQWLQERVVTNEI